MDKVSFLVLRVDDALLKFQTLLNAEELSGPMRTLVLAEYKDESAEVFGESYAERTDELLQYALLLTIFDF